MTRRTALRIVWALLSVAAGHAIAQTPVYRCGKEGNEYSSVPCPGGRPVDVGDERSAAQRRQAQEIARREQRQAEQLAAERRRRDAQAASPAALPRPSASAAAQDRKAPGPSAAAARSTPKPSASQAAFTAKAPPAVESVRPAGR